MTITAAEETPERHIRFQSEPEDIGLERADTEEESDYDFDDDDIESAAKVKSPPPRNLNNLTPKFAAKQLRGNLMREQRNRDPLFYYDVVTVLGVGSMGSVAKVKKKDAVIGGSARKPLQDHFQREKQLKACFQIPFLGGIFNHCLKGQLEYKDQPSIRTRTNSQNSFGSSILAPRGNATESPGAAATSEDYDMYYAMKSIHLSRVTDVAFIDELKNEIGILKRLDHPHVVKAIETLEFSNQIFIVMEQCSGGDLYSRDPYTEAEAARITSSILSAISYMHSKNISHRDLKYENILFANNGPKAEIKLIDFGLSKKFGKDELTEGVGTIYTMAPEVLKGSYTNAADLWSVGVIAFMLLSSQMPFFGRKRRHIVEQIMMGRYEFKGRRWKKLSDQSKAFVSDLLVVDFEERATAEEALAASWLNRRFNATVRDPHAAEEISARQSLSRYSNYSKLKKVALMVVAHRSTSTEIGILRKMFQKYDTKRDGHLSYVEFQAAMKDSGEFTEDECQEIFHSMDLDGSGKIRYTEFLAATIEAQGAISEERLAEAFDRLDSDDSGYISAENLRELLGEEFPEDEISSIIAETDLTKDGKISYAEFLALWEDQHENTNVSSLKQMSSLLNVDSVRSELSFESLSDDGVSDLVARANFISGKQLSVRKATKVGFDDTSAMIAGAKEG